jgi:hypothetical protein
VYSKSSNDFVAPVLMIMNIMKRSDEALNDGNAFYRSLGSQSAPSAATHSPSENARLSDLISRGYGQQERASMGGLTSPSLSGPSELQLFLAQQQQQQRSNPSADIQAALLQQRLLSSRPPDGLGRLGLRDNDAALALFQQRQREEDLFASQMLAQQRHVDEILSRAGQCSNNATFFNEQLLARAGMGHFGSLAGSMASQNLLRTWQQQQHGLSEGVGLERGSAASNILAGSSAGGSTRFPEKQQKTRRDDSEHSVKKTDKTLELPKSVEVDEADEEEDADNQDPNSDTFPFKLYRMLSEAEKDGKEDIVSFLHHGRAFAIHKPRDFVAEIMPKYFTTSRMSSFQRQLNLYGFRRITEGQDKGGYFHENFVKGRKSLCKKIRRKKTSVKAPPNFFPGSMPTTGNLGGGAASLGDSLSVRQLLADGHTVNGSARSGGAMATGNPFLGAGMNPTFAAAIAMEQQRRQQQEHAQLMQLILRQQQQQGGGGHLSGAPAGSSGMRNLPNFK